MLGFCVCVHGSVSLQMMMSNRLAENRAKNKRHNLDIDNYHLSVLYRDFTHQLVYIGKYGKYKSIWVIIGIPSSTNPFFI